MPKDEPLVTGGFLTADPNYYRATTFREILGVILSHKNYTPQSITGGQDRVSTSRFGRDSVELLSNKWETTLGPLGWDLERRRPHIEVDIWKAYPLFEPFIIHIERDFLTSSANLVDFVHLLKGLYNVIHPAYGDVLLRSEMIRLDDPVEGKRNLLGFNLKRALPNIYWATFLGPEYVEMFGPAKVMTAPVFSAERLPDGGALLLLTETPFDCLSDRERFERLQMEAKRHLGVEAFDTGDKEFKGIVPEFRFVEEKENLRQRIFRWDKKFSTKEQDLLSRIKRQEWDEWVRNNSAISKELSYEVKEQGVKLDFSPASLVSLDDYVGKLRAKGRELDVDLIKKVAAYVSQILIRETGAVWSFESSKDLPVLKLGTAEISPLVRAQKVLLEDEHFEPWYRFIKQDLVQSSRSTG